MTAYPSGRWVPEKYVASRSDSKTSGASRPMPASRWRVSAATEVRARSRHREHDQPDPRARHLCPPQRLGDALGHGRGGGLRPDGGRVAAARDGVAQALAGRMDDHGAGARAAGVDGDQSGAVRSFVTYS